MKLNSDMNFMKDMFMIAGVGSVFESSRLHKVGLQIQMSTSTMHELILEPEVVFNNS